MSITSDLQKLKNTIKSLKLKNAELTETLRVIQSGEVDALVVSGPMGERVFTLQTSEQPYRELVEAMNEGALTVSPDGIILYCNERFQAMVKVPHEKLVSSDIRAHIRPESRQTLEMILERGRVVPSSAEMLLNVAGRASLPIQLSISKIQLVGAEGFCMIATDLSAAKQSAIVFQQQEWLGTLLNLLPVPLILIEEDLRGFTFVNEMARGVLQGFEKKAKLSNENISLSFLNENGDVFKLDELMAKIASSSRTSGYETILVLKEKRIPVLLFAEALPAVHGRKSAKLLMFQDISIIKQAQLDLSQALHGRDQFMAALSHELRTPLNVILGWVQLLRANPHDQGLVKQALDTLERNADLQRDLIEDLLDMSRIITGNLVLQKKPLDLKKSVQEAVTSLQIKAEEKSIQLKLDLIEAPSIVLADEKRVQQLISNLLQNAIKFTPQFGEIEIIVRTESNRTRALIQIKDNGQGIEPNFLPHVFDQFKQENMSTNRSYGGLGLGLAICKTIVTQHGGEIMAESQGRGLGATFTVKLPLSAQTRTSAAASVMHSGKSIDLSGLRVLVVDDSKDNLALFTIWLHNSGAEILTQESAAGVVETIRDFKPHVLLSDISMPGEDGYALISKVRALPAHLGGHIPAGAITANARTEDRDLSIAAGFHMHIPKPVTAFSLVKAVKSLSEMARY